ncbi:hypothetical protein GGI43DRAFT_15750 [Trichoderma evansii]
MRPPIGSEFGCSISKLWRRYIHTSRVSANVRPCVLVCKVSYTRTFTRYLYRYRSGAFTCTGYLFTMITPYIVIHRESRNRAGAHKRAHRNFSVSIFARQISVSGNLQIKVALYRNLHIQCCHRLTLSFCTNFQGHVMQSTLSGQVPAGSVSIPLQPSHFHFRWESNIHVGKGTLRRTHGVECIHFKGSIKLPSY